MNDTPSGDPRLRPEKSFRVILSLRSAVSFAFCKFIFSKELIQASFFAAFERDVAMNAVVQFFCRKHAETIHTNTFERQYSRVAGGFSSFFDQWYVTE